MYFREVVFPAMTELRAPIDELEMIVDEEFWRYLHMASYCLKYKRAFILIFPINK